MTKRYNENVEYQEYNKRQSTKNTRKLRRAVINAYGGQCACCAETWDAYLEIDHIDNDGGKRREELGGRQLNRLEWRQLRRDGFPPNIVQILCANCHAAKSKGVPCKPHN